PPIETSRLPPLFCLKAPESVRIPVLVAESPGLITPLDCRVPLMNPLPNRLPADNVTDPEVDRVPSSVSLPAVCVKLPTPPSAKRLPAPIVRAPAFEKLPIVVKARAPCRLKRPVEALVAKFARALALLVELRIFEAAPVSVMLAALVTMLAPANCKVPATL